MRSNARAEPVERRHARVAHERGRVGRRTAPARRAPRVPRCRRWSRRSGGSRSAGCGSRPSAGASGRGRPAIAGARSRRPAAGGGWRARADRRAITRTASKKASTGRAQARGLVQRRGEVAGGDGACERPRTRRWRPPARASLSVLERATGRARAAASPARSAPAGGARVNAVWARREVVGVDAPPASARARRRAPAGRPAAAPRAARTTSTGTPSACQQRRRRGRARTATRPRRLVGVGGQVGALLDEQRVAPGARALGRSSGQPRSRAIATTPAAARRRPYGSREPGRPLADGEARSRARRACRPARARAPGALAGSARAGAVGQELLADGLRDAASAGPRARAYSAPT